MTILILLSLASQAQSSQQNIDAAFVRTLKNKQIPSDSLLLVGKQITMESRAARYERGVVRGNILAGLGFLYGNELDSAANYLLNVIQDSETMEPGSFEEGLGHNYLGSVFTRLNNHNRALQEFNLGIEIFKKINNDEYIAVGLSNAGTAYGAQGNLIKALEFFLEAQKLASHPDVTDDLRASILSNISMVYSFMDKKREALNFAFAALALDVKTENNIGLCQSYNVIGNIYKQNKDYDSALLFFNKTLAFATDNNPEFTPIALRALQNKADIYTRQNNFREAIRLLRQGQKANSRYQVEVIYNYLALYYNKLNKYDSAIYFSRLALNKARLAGSHSSMATACENLNIAFFNLRKFDSAYHYQSKQVAFKDSVYNERNKARFDNLRIELETLDKEREVYAIRKQVELDKATDTLLLVLVVATFVVVILMLLSVILLYKNRQKQEQLKSLALEDKLIKSNADLRNQTLRMIHINNGMQEIEASLKKLRSENSGSEVNQVLKNLTINQTLEKEWETFTEYFGNIHVGFYEKLDQDFPKLTIAEKRLASLVRMNLTNREIAGIINIEDSSVKMAKYRLKKKLNVVDDQDLATFLNQLTKDEKPGQAGA